MALTKISGSILKDPLNLGEVSIGGTLTYQDVTNVDSVGIITARSTIDAQGDVSIADKIVHTGDTDTTIRFPSADTIRFDTGGTEAARITSEQKFVIGDTNSTAKLGVIRDSFNLAEFTNTNADATGAELSLRKDSASPADNDSLGTLNFIGDNDAGQKTTYAYIQSKSTDVSDGTEDGTLQFNTRGGGTLAERLRITSGGAVGINQTAPEAQLHVENDNAHGSTYYLNSDAAILVDNKNNSGKAVIKLEHDAALVYGSGSSSFIISDRENERLRIDSSGRIGIGENNPTRDIVIKKSGSVQVSMVGATNQGVYLNFGDTDDDNIGAVYYDNPNDRMIIRANTNNAVQVKSNGNMAINDGDLEIGTSGHGISFAATSDASGMSNELLDDYEEGSWTPTILGWDTFTHYSGSSYYAGWYVKVGNMVHCGWKIYYQNLSTPSSNTHIRISGLPYAAKTISAGPVCHVRFDIPDFSFSGYPVPYLAGNDTTIGFYKQVNGSNNISAINATGNYSNNWTMGTATYATN